MSEPPDAKPAWWHGRALSFRYAFRGLAFCLRTQHNARIHTIAAVLVIALAFALKISALEWCAILISIVLVCSAECFNTAIEGIVDLLSPEIRPLAGRIKDAAAAAVLCLAIGAAIVGAIIFAPKLVALFSR